MSLNLVCQHTRSQRSKKRTYWERPFSLASSEGGSGPTISSSSARAFCIAASSSSVRGCSFSSCFDFDLSVSFSRLFLLLFSLSRRLSLLLRFSRRLRSSSLPSLAASCDILRDRDRELLDLPPTSSSEFSDDVYRLPFLRSLSLSRSRRRRLRRYSSSESMSDPDELEYLDRRCRLASFLLFGRGESSNSESLLYQTLLSNSHWRSDAIMDIPVITARLLGRWWPYRDRTSFALQPTPVSCQPIAYTA